MEAIYLGGGAGGPQLKRNPLYSGVHHDKGFVVFGARATTSEHIGRCPRWGAPSSSRWFPEEQGRQHLASRPRRPPLSNTRFKLAAHGLGRIPFVPHCTSCSSVNSDSPVGLRAAA
jgi:hypothetical protein